jgi:hypothetical protein
MAEFLPMYGVCVHATLVSLFLFLSLVSYTFVSSFLFFFSLISASFNVFSWIV